MRQVNLLPERFRQAGNKRVMTRSAAIMAAMVFFAALTVHLLLSWRIGSYQNVAAELKNIGDLPEYSPLHRAIGQIEREKKRFTAENKGLLDVLSGHLASSHILRYISAANSGKIWLTEIIIDPQKNTCAIGGRSYSARSVSEFMLGLKKSPFFKNIDLTSMEKAQVPQEREVKFAITCNFR